MGAPSNRTATLESQMIPMIQDVPGQTLRASALVLARQIDEIRCSSASDLVDLLAK